MNKEIAHDVAKLREASVIETLDEKRRDLDFSFRDLARVSGVSHSTINDIFRRKQIKLWQVYVFAEALGMTIREVTYLAEEQFSEKYDLLYVESEESVAESVV